MTTPPGGFGLARIGQIAVNVKDLSRATQFYRETLGMRFLFEVPGMAFFDCAGLRLMLAVPEKPEFDHQASILYYQVEEIRAAHEILVGKGVEFIEPPRLVAPLPHADLWMAFFRDSEGNPLALMSEVRRA
jgi:methylmalonyl-CoA/ethylmalonyl-CoA epimerase